VTVLFTLLLACSSKLPTATIQVGDQRVKVEIAATYEHRALGLKHRDTLARNTGMLFVYSDNKPRSFWMKSVKLPLSIAFADRQGTIVRITDMAPMDTDKTASLYPAMYALEMNKGWFNENNVKKGDTITNIPSLDVE